MGAGWGGGSGMSILVDIASIYIVRVINRYNTKQYNTFTVHKMYNYTPFVK